MTQPMALLQTSPLKGVVVNPLVIPETGVTCPSTMDTTATPACETQTLMGPVASVLCSPAISTPVTEYCVFSSQSSMGSRC